MEFLSDSGIIVQSDGIGNSSHVADNTSSHSTPPDTVSCQNIIRPVSGPFDDLSSSEQSSEKSVSMQASQNTLDMEHYDGNNLSKNYSGIDDEGEEKEMDVSTKAFSDADIENNKDGSNTSIKSSQKNKNAGEEISKNEEINKEEIQLQEEDKVAQRQKDEKAEKDELEELLTQQEENAEKVAEEIHTKSRTGKNAK